MGDVDAVLARHEPDGAVQEPPEGLPARLHVRKDEVVEIEDASEHCLGIGKAQGGREYRLDGADLPVEFDVLRLVVPEAVKDGRHGGPVRDRIGQSVHAALGFVAPLAESDKFAAVVPSSSGKFLHDAPACVFDDIGCGEGLPDTGQDAVLGDRLADGLRVGAGAALRVVVAAVVSAVGSAAVEVHRRAAYPADEQSRQEVLAGSAGALRARSRTSPLWATEADCVVGELFADRSPCVGRDDAKFLALIHEDLRFRADHGDSFAGAGVLAELARAVPPEPGIPLVGQHRSDAGLVPTVAQPTAVAARRRDAVGVESPGDAREIPTGRELLEDPTDDDGRRGIDFDALPAKFRRVHRPKAERDLTGGEAPHRTTVEAAPSLVAEVIDEPLAAHHTERVRDLACARIRVDSIGNSEEADAPVFPVLPEVHSVGHITRKAVHVLYDNAVHLLGFDRLDQRLDPSLAHQARATGRAVAVDVLSEYGAAAGRDVLGASLDLVVDREITLPVRGVPGVDGDGESGEVSATCHDTSLRSRSP